MFEIIYLSDPTDGDNLKTDPFFMERGLDLFDYYFLSFGKDDAFDGEDEVFY